MINKVYVSTSDAGLIRSAQTIAIARLGYMWIMGPVDKMRTVQDVPKSKWAWMVLDGSNGGIYTTNSNPNTSNKNVAVATSVSTITEAFAPTTPLVPPPTPPPFVLSFEALINSNVESSITATAPLTGVFVGTHTYNGAGTVTGIWDFGDGSSTEEYTSSATVNHTFETGSWTASLALTESTYNSTSVAVVYVVGNVPVLTPLFYVITSSAVAPLTAAFANSSSVSVGSSSYSYNWVFGDETNDSVYQPTHVYDTGSFPVRLEITESYYGIAEAYELPGGITASVPVVIASFTTNSIGLGGLTESYMEPLTMSFTSSVSYNGNGALTYYWDFGNSESSSMEPPPEAFYGTGSFTASLTVTENSYGITSVYTRSFEVST